MSGKNRKRQKDRQTTARMLTLITQFGINMLVPIFLCFFAGWYLDRKFGTSYLIIVFFFIGALAGFRNMFVLAGRMMKEPKNRDLNNTEDDQKGIPNG